MFLSLCTACRIQAVMLSSKSSKPTCSRYRVYLLHCFLQVECVMNLQMWSAFHSEQRSRADTLEHMIPRTSHTHTCRHGCPKKFACVSRLKQLVKLGQRLLLSGQETHILFDLLCLFSHQASPLDATLVFKLIFVRDSRCLRYLLGSMNTMWHKQCSCTHGNELLTSLNPSVQL